MLEGRRCASGGQMGVGLGCYAEPTQGGLVRPVAKICFMLRPLYALCDMSCGEFMRQKWQLYESNDRILERVRVPDPLVRRQFDIRAAKDMGRAGAEVGERHPVAAANPRVALVDLAGKSVRREPFGHRVGVEEGSTDTLGRGAEHSMQADGVRGIGHSVVSPAKRVGLSLAPLAFI